MNIGLLTGWQIYKVNKKYFISNTHFIYIEFIIKKFTNIYLFAPVKLLDNLNSVKDFKEIKFDNLKIIELPFYANYKGAIPYILNFYNALKMVSSKTDLFYCRVPDPFSWMPRLIFRKRTIMHFVGDAIEVIKNNSNFSIFQKMIYLILFSPEYLLTLLASKFSYVYTNGFIIASKLKKYRINAEPVISSTLKESDFFIKEFNPKKDELKLLYVGYIRFSKGVETLIFMADKLIKDGINIKLNIVGDGEASFYIKDLVKKLNINNSVRFYGHIDSKEKINTIYRNNDIFVFASLAEGSPRVVLEAMSNSLPVISTPVGSLPKIFSSNKEILFANYNDYEDFANKILFLYRNNQKANEIVKNAYHLVYKKYTLENFLEVVFKNET